jgi:hypothetical protein
MGSQRDPGDRRDPEQGEAFRADRLTADAHQAHDLIEETRSGPHRNRPYLTAT